MAVNLSGVFFRIMAVQTFHDFSPIFIYSIKNHVNNKSNHHGRNRYGG